MVIVIGYREYLFLASIKLCAEYKCEITLMVKIFFLKVIHFEKVK